MFIIFNVNVREYQTGNHKWSIQSNIEQHRVHNTKKNKAKTQHYTQANTNNVNICEQQDVNVPLHSTKQ